MRILKNLLKKTGNDKTNISNIEKAIKNFRRLNLDVMNDGEKFIICKSYSNNKITFNNASELIRFNEAVLENLSLKSCTLLRNISQVLMHNEKTLSEILDCINRFLIKYNICIYNATRLNQAVKYFGTDVAEMLFYKIIDDDNPAEFSVCYGCKNGKYSPDYDIIECKKYQIVPPTVSVSKLIDGDVKNGKIYTRLITYPVNKCYDCKQRSKLVKKKENQADDDLTLSRTQSEFNIDIK